jgi:uncharacterized membrane protein HdeD (DUF308 family)
MLATLVRNWWLFAARGVAALIFGVLAILWPFVTLQVIVLIFGAYVLIDGVFAVISGIRSFGESRRWWLLVLDGLAGIAVGVLTFLWPEVTALVLLYFIAAWAIVTGILEIAAAIQLRREITGEWRLVLGGVASIVFGVLLVIFPGAGALGLVWLIGAYGILFGILLIALAFRLRAMRGEVKPAAPTPA